MSLSRIVVFGGTGFVGRRLVAELVRRGFAVTVPSRNRERQRDLLVLPGVEVVTADVYAAADLRRLLDGAQAAINLIGILNERGRRGHGFQRAHVDFTDSLIAACRASGVRRLLQMSALNAGRGESHYLRTRGQAEDSVRGSGLEWTIFQPSVIFGPGDGLFDRFAKLLRLAPVLPLARADARFAPVYVGDVTEAFVRALEDPATIGQLYEIYGAETLSLAEIVRYTARCLGLRRAILPLPDALGRLQAAIFDFVPGKPFSTDNFLSLKRDAVGGIDGLYRLGIEKTPIDAIVPQQLGVGARQPRHDRWRRARRA
ncbi:MAG TPA: complex I NDUFA9 subunit family protein [Chiayiivirga sp.]|nr:complex I NDUFA9 subunit family protein [Xanthomonadaceae bacterium]HMN34266.1 complex I NDUFA9 subunit family protein [Chiayiivirga sp.]